MANKIQTRRDTAANWASVNPVLSQGEKGIETDIFPPKYKIGDGSTAWNSLGYGEASSAVSISVAGNSNVTLTTLQASANIITFTGALTGSINVLVPASGRSWMFINSTSGAYTVTVKTSAGSGIVVPQGYGLELLCDGTNVLDTESAKAGIASSNTFARPQVSGSLALTNSSAWDGSAATGAQSLTVNVNGSTFTISNPTSAVTGAIYMIDVTYTTSNTLGFGTVYKGITGITWTATSGKYDTIYFKYDGTSMRCVGYSLNNGA